MTTFKSLSHASRSHDNAADQVTMTAAERTSRPDVNPQLGFEWARPTSRQPVEARPTAEDKDAPPSPQVGDEPLTPAMTEDAPFEATAVTGHGYGPGHPWHYLPRGDAASPVTFESIPPSGEAGRALERELPRQPAKRLVRSRELLQTERLRLEEDRRRYEDVIMRGAEALSRYDREIAYGGNDELALASTLALKFNHIAWTLGRIGCLEREVSRSSGWRRG